MATIISGEGLIALHQAWDQMTRAGENSLRAAYNFGQIADALKNAGISWDVMGHEVDRSAATIHKYANLYRRYPRVEMLLEASEYHDTFDVSILVRPEDTQIGHGKFGYQCGNCGSWDTHRKPAPADAA